MERRRSDEPVVLELTPRPGIVGWRALWAGLALGVLGATAALTVTELLVSARRPVLGALVGAPAEPR
jgi:hypothetical protein